MPTCRVDSKWRLAVSANPLLSQYSFSTWFFDMEGNNVSVVFQSAFSR